MANGSLNEGLKGGLSPKDAERPPLYQFSLYTNKTMHLIISITSCYTPSLFSNDE